MPDIRLAREFRSKIFSEQVEDRKTAILQYVLQLFLNYVLFIFVLFFLSQENELVAFSCVGLFAGFYFSWTVKQLVACLPIAWVTFCERYL